MRGINLRALLSTIPALFVLATQADIGFTLGAVVLLALGMVARVLGWTRHTYELRGGRIIERQGLLSRTERALEIERIQQIDIERTLLDRAVGTCELRMETAADSGDSELTLTVVTVEEAARLRGVLAEASGRLESASVALSGPDVGDGVAGAPDTGAGASAPSPGRPDASSAGTGTNTATGPAGTERGPTERQLVEVPLQHVALAAVTGPRLLVIPAGIAVVLGLLGDAFQPGPEETTRVASDAIDAALGLGAIAAAVSVLGGLVLAFVVVAVVGVLRDGGFEIVRRGHEVVVRRGLTTTRSATVPLRRIQRVSVGRSWIHGLVGFATVTIHTAGSVSRGGQGDAQANLDRSLVVPLLPEHRVAPLLEELLGTADVPPLWPHPAAARRRSVVRAIGQTGVPVLAIGVAVAIGLRSVPVAITALVLALVLTVGVGVARYRRLATGLGDQLVCGRTGIFGTTTHIALRRKVQGVGVRATWFQRRRGLATADVHVAGGAGGLRLPDLASSSAVDVQQALT